MDQAARNEGPHPFFIDQPAICALSKVRCGLGESTIGNDGTAVAAVVHHASKGLLNGAVASNYLDQTGSGPRRVHDRSGVLFCA